MSIRRIGSRAAVVGVGVLASLAFTAAPSWAAKESGLCAPGAYSGVLFAQEGSAFKNARACAKYVAKGGPLGGVDAVAGPPVGGSFSESCTGFGLEPSTANVTREYSCGALYSNGIFTGQYGPSSTGGTWSVSTSLSCTEGGGTVVSIQVLVRDLDGTTVEREFPAPSGC